jgi:hypothetical protein
MPKKSKKKDKEDSLLKKKIKLNSLDKLKNSFFDKKSEIPKESKQNIIVTVPKKIQGLDEGIEKRGSNFHDFINFFSRRTSESGAIKNSVNPIEVQLAEVSAKKNDKDDKKIKYTEIVNYDSNHQSVQYDPVSMNSIDMGKRDEFNGRRIINIGEWQKTMGEQEIKRGDENYTINAQRQDYSSNLPFEQKDKKRRINI